MESIKEKIKIVQSKIEASKTDKNVKPVSYTHLRAHETR